MDDVPGERRRGGAGSTILVAIVTSVLTSVLVSLVVVKMTSAPAGAPGAEGQPKAEADDDGVEVPSIVGLTIAQAREMVTARDLLLTLEDERDDANVAAGGIVTQTPLAGSRVKKKSAVSAIVSRGMGKVRVPDVTGMAPDQAAVKLSEAHLQSAGIVEAASATTPKGIVAGTTPPAMTEVAPGTPVQITVSSGAGEVEVPKVTGIGITRARAALEQAGFVVGATSFQYDENYGGNIVLRQKPAAGTTAPPGSKINLVLNEPD